MFAGSIKLLTIKEIQSQAWHSNSLFVLAAITQQQTQYRTVPVPHTPLSEGLAELISPFPVIIIPKL